MEQIYEKGFPRFHAGEDVRPVTFSAALIHHESKTSVDSIVL